jgi:hypothetical protein
MPMSLGDFFSSAQHARPSNPRAVTFTAMAKGGMLPGGRENVHKVPVLAKVTGCLVFLGGDGAELARVEARQSLLRRFVDAETGYPKQTDGEDFNLELTYQILWRVLHEWDEKDKRAGARLFPEPENVREMLEPTEANRVLRAYNAYVADEHPEVVNDKTFRDAEGAGKGAPRK